MAQLVELISPTFNHTHVVGKGGFRIDVELADFAGPITGGLEVAGDVRRVFPIHAETPRRQTNLPVLVRIQSGQNAGTGLTATGLRDEGAIEAHALRREFVEVRRLRIRIAVAAELRAVVLGDDEEDVGRRGK